MILAMTFYYSVYTVNDTGYNFYYSVYTVNDTGYDLLLFSIYS